MEVGQHLHGFRSCPTYHEEEIFLHLGYSGQIDKVSTFPASEDDVQGRGSRKSIRGRNCKAAWSPHEHSLRQGSKVYFAILECTTRGPRDETKTELCLSPPDRWTNGKDYSVPGRFVESLCLGPSRKLGRAIAIGRIHLQQQLSCQYWNGTL